LAIARQWYLQVSQLFLRQPLSASISASYWRLTGLFEDNIIVQAVVVNIIIVIDINVIKY